MKMKININNIYMKIGFITGKDDEICLDKNITSKVLKKHYVNGDVHTDVLNCIYNKRKIC